MGKRLKATLILTVGISIILVLYFTFFYSFSIDVRHGQTDRKVWVHKPVGGVMEKAPLVIVLHGYGDHPRIIEMYSGFSRKADSEKFIVAYPTGTRSLEDVSLSWNAGECCGTAVKLGVNDVEYLKLVISELKNRFSIDEQKVFVTGFSNGAMMTYRLASESENLISAIAGVSGSTNGINPPTRPISVMMIHGRTDMVVPYDGGESVHESLKGDVYFSSVDQTVNFWKNANRCRFENINEKVSGVLEHNFSGCDNGSVFSAISISDRGHIWPGGLLELSIYGQSKGVKATDLIWDFFES